MGRERPDNPSSIVKDLIAGENVLVEGDLSPAQYEALLRNVASELTQAGRGNIVPDLRTRVLVPQHGYTGGPPVIPGNTGESGRSEEVGNGP